MSGTNVTVTSHKGLSMLVRPKFGPGMLLHHDDLEQLSSYTRDLNRLMFRSLFGCGVICGLVVEVNTKCGKVCVTIGAGLGLNCAGDPIHLPKAVSIAIDEQCDPKFPGELWVVLCSTVKCCAPRTAICASDEDESPAVCTRERDGFEIRVVSARPECACGCPEPLDGKAMVYQESARGSASNWSDSSVPVGEDAADDRCKCADSRIKCYEEHYAGKCGCHGGDGCSDCGGCECMLLARLNNAGNLDNPDKSDWRVDHSVRRFTRPVLMRDPQVELELAKKKLAQDAARRDAEAEALAAALTREAAAKPRTKSTRAAKSTRS